MREARRRRTKLLVTNAGAHCEDERALALERLLSQGVFDLRAARQPRVRCFDPLADGLVSAEGELEPAPRAVMGPAHRARNGAVQFSA